jgi:hypothetical protein
MKRKQEAAEPTSCAQGKSSDDVQLSKSELEESAKGAGDSRCCPSAVVVSPRSKDRRKGILAGRILIFLFPQM